MSLSLGAKSASGAVISKSMLRAIEEFYSKFQSVKDKSRKVDVIKSGNGELQELGM